MIVEMIGHCQHMIRCPTAEIDFVHYNTVHLIQKKLMTSKIDHVRWPWHNPIDHMPLCVSGR